MKKRVVITGMGVVSPVGIGIAKLWDNSLKMKSGINKLTRIDTEGFPTGLGAEVREFDPGKYISKNNVNNMDITSQFATAAASMAVADAGFARDDANLQNAGVVIGTTLGTISFILDQQRNLDNGDYRSIHRHTGYIALHNSLSSDVSIELGSCGISETISSACVSGLSAIQYGLSKIRHEGYDVMVVGGADSAFRPLPYAGLNVIRILSNDGIKPFDVDADGTVLGEGAAVLIIEEYEHARKRGAQMYAEILEACFTCESLNHFGHEEKPVQSVRALLEAIKMSGLQPKDIDFVNAHGLGVKTSDLFETMTYEECFGGKLTGEICFTSIKPYIGHPLAAASAFQVVYAALMVKKKTLIPTLNFKKQNNGHNLNIVKNVIKSSHIKHGIVNAMAFGGKCGACVIRRID